jgi:transcriptional regulator with XRE-family HTH domain
MLNDNIRTIRKNKGFTQEDLANRLHVTGQIITEKAIRMLL